MRKQNIELTQEVIEACEIVYELSNPELPFSMEKSELEGEKQCGVGVPLGPRAQFLCFNQFCKYIEDKQLIFTPSHLLRLYHLYNKFSEDSSYDTFHEFLCPEADFNFSTILMDYSDENFKPLVKLIKEQDIKVLFDMGAGYGVLGCLLALEFGEDLTIITIDQYKINIDLLNKGHSETIGDCNFAQRLDEKIQALMARGDITLDNIAYTSFWPVFGNGAWWSNAFRSNGVNKCIINHGGDEGQCELLSDYYYIHQPWVELKAMLDKKDCSHADQLWSELCKSIQSPVQGRSAGHGIVDDFGNRLGEQIFWKFYKRYKDDITAEVLERIRKLYVKAIEQVSGPGNYLINPNIFCEEKLVSICFQQRAKEVGSSSICTSGLFDESPERYVEHSSKDRMYPK